MLVLFKDRGKTPETGIETRRVVELEAPSAEEEELLTGMLVVTVEVNVVGKIVVKEIEVLVPGVEVEPAAVEVL